MGGGRGGVVREVREHSSVASSSSQFPALPNPTIKALLGKH